MPLRKSTLFSGSWNRSFQGCFRTNTLSHFLVLDEEKCFSALANTQLQTLAPGFIISYHFTQELTGIVGTDSRVVPVFPFLLFCFSELWADSKEGRMIILPSGVAVFQMFSIWFQCDIAFGRNEAILSINKMSKKVTKI